MIYLCIPARNEARTIGPLVWKVRSVMRDFGRDFEILVLDDASEDGTAEVLEPYRDLVPLHVIRTEAPLGYGGAVDRLLRAALERAPYPKRDAAVVLQGDLTEDPADVVQLVKALEGGADIVTGALKEQPEGLTRMDRLARWAVPRLLGRTQRTAPVSDLVSGPTLYRIVVLRKAQREEERVAPASASRWYANAALLQRLAPHARRIEEAPVVERPGIRVRPSRFRPFGTLRELIALRGHRWNEDYGDGRVA